MCQILERETVYGWTYSRAHGGRRVSQDHVDVCEVTAHMYVHIGAHVNQESS